MSLHPGGPVSSRGRSTLCGPSMEHFRVLKEDLIFTDLPLVEYLTLMKVMARDNHLFV